eukprot:gene11097-13564_t
MNDESELLRRYADERVDAAFAEIVRRHLDGVYSAALRRVGAADWSDSISQTSLVLRAMLQSPVFAAEDESTRNTTLHGIENLSARSGQGEAAVAQALLVLMSGADGEPPDHPGAAQALA